MSPYRVCFGEEREVILCRATEDGKGAGTNSDFTHGSNCHWAMPFANNQLRPQLNKREEVTVSLNPLRHRYRAYWTLSRTHFQSAVNSSVLGLNWCCLPWQGYCMCVYVTTLHLQITMSPHYSYISLCHHITLTDHDVTTLHLQITMSPHYTYISQCHDITLTDHNVTTLHLQITMSPLTLTVSPYYTYRSLCHHITLTDHCVTTLHLQITVSPYCTYRSPSGYHCGYRSPTWCRTLAYRSPTWCRTLAYRSSTWCLILDFRSSICIILAYRSPVGLIQPYRSSTRCLALVYRSSICVIPAYRSQ